jgi:2,4-dienoyl-CoA reductase-like NADH-dependent reductase (Old Yellow Enzyme family)
MGEYFSQRATSLSVTECTAVSEQGKGVINGPGLWRDDQVKGWREVTDAVHKGHGRIFLPALALRSGRPPQHARGRGAGRAFASPGRRQVQVSKSGSGFPQAA